MCFYGDFWLQTAEMLLKAEITTPKLLKAEITTPKRP
jgi:hypothetical protein